MTAPDILAAAERGIDYHIAADLPTLLPNLDPALAAVKVAAITEQLDTAQQLENRSVDSAAWLDGAPRYRSPEARDRHIEELADLYRSNAAHDAQQLADLNTQAGKAQAA
jgi:hypothetical protein